MIHVKEKDADATKKKSENEKNNFLIDEALAAKESAWAAAEKEKAGAELKAIEAEQPIIQDKANMNAAKDAKDATVAKAKADAEVCLAAFPILSSQASCHRKQQLQLHKGRLQQRLRKLRSKRQRLLLSKSSRKRDNIRQRSLRRKHEMLQKGRPQRSR